MNPVILLKFLKIIKELFTTSEVILSDGSKVAKRPTVIQHATKVIAPTMVMVSVAVGTIEWLDHNYVKAEEISKLQVEVNSIETSFELFLLENKIRGIKMELREIRSEYGRKLEDADDYIEEQYDELEDELMSKKHEYVEIVKLQKEKFLKEKR